MKAEILGLGKDSIIYGVGSVITRFIGLFTLPLFTAYLTPEAFGVLAMLALLGTVAQPVFSLGLSAAMGPSYFESNNPDIRSKAVWSAFGINFVSASLLVCIAWGLPAFLGELVRLPQKYSHLVSLSLSGTALTILVTSFTQRVQFEKQACLYVAITIATALVAILVSIQTVVFLGRGVEGMVYGQLAGNSITFLAFFLVGIKSTKPQMSIRTINELLRLGLPLVPSFAFCFILMHSNKYILEWHSGLDAVGIYSIGFNLGSSIGVVTGGIAAAWYPFFMSYQEKQDEAKVVFGRILTYYFMIIGSLCAAFFIFARPAVQFLTHKPFFEASTVIGFVALGNFCVMLFNFFLPSLYFEKKVKYVSLVQGITATIGLPISYLLIAQYSLLGAAVAVFVNNFLMALLLLFWNKVFFKASFSAIYEWRRVFIITWLLTMIVLLYSLWTTVPLRFEILWSFIFWSFCLITYFVLTSKERMALKNFLKLGRLKPNGQ